MKKLIMLIIMCLVLTPTLGCIKKQPAVNLDDTINANTEQPMSNSEVTTGQSANNSNVPAQNQPNSDTSGQTSTQPNVPKEVNPNNTNTQTKSDAPKEAVPSNTNTQTKPDTPKDAAPSTTNSNDEVVFITKYDCLGKYGPPDKIQLTHNGKTFFLKVNETSHELSHVVGSVGYYTEIFSLDSIKMYIISSYEAKYRKIVLLFGIDTTKIGYNYHPYVFEYRNGEIVEQEFISIEPIIKATSNGLIRVTVPELNVSRDFEDNSYLAQQMLKDGSCFSTYIIDASPALGKDSGERNLALDIRCYDPNGSYRYSMAGRIDITYKATENGLSPKAAEIYDFRFIPNQELEEYLKIKNELTINSVFRPSHTAGYEFVKLTPETDNEPENSKARGVWYKKGDSYFCVYNGTFPYIDLAQNFKSILIKPFLPEPQIVNFDGNYAVCRDTKIPDCEYYIDFRKSDLSEEEKIRIINSIGSVIDE